MGSQKSVSINEAIAILGVGRPLLERWLRQGTCPFGEYIREDGKQSGTYYINRERFNTYVHAKDMHIACPYRTILS